MLRFHALLPLLFPLAWLAAVPAVAAGKDMAGDRTALEAQPQAAHARLDEAQREVTELSVRLAAAEPGRTVRRVHTPDHTMLGMQIVGSPGSRDVTVAAVTAGGPAAEAGILPGDVIVALGGRSIAGDHDFVRAMRGVEPDGKVPLDLRRGGRLLQVYVMARALAPGDWYFDQPLPAPAALGHLPGMPPMASWTTDESGIGCGDAPGAAQFATLTPALARYFGTGQGVLVVRAPAGDAFQLQDGDVLAAIDGRVPRNGAHALDILQSYQPGEKLTLQVLRQRKEHRIEVTMPPDPDERVRRRHAPAPASSVPGTPATPLRP